MLRDMGDAGCTKSRAPKWLKQENVYVEHTAAAKESRGEGTQ